MTLHELAFKILRACALFPADGGAALDAINPTSLGSAAKFAMAYQLLEDIKAVDSDGYVTASGRARLDKGALE